MHLRATILAACTLSACASALKNEQTGIPVVGDIRVNRYELSNGLKLLVVEDDSSPTFAYQTWYRVGSRDERPGYTGLAHLFEHMMFKRTKNRSTGEFDRKLQEAGAEGDNAFTSRDYTAYIQELPKNALELIVQLEADRMKNLVVDYKSFKTETEVVRNERRFRTENSPDGMMYQALFQTSYRKHPYRWPVIGHKKDLDRLTSSDAQEFYRRFYNPERATIVVVGDVDTSNVLGLVKQHYGAIENSTFPTPYASSLPEPQQRTARRKTLRLGLETEKLLIGYRVPGVSDTDTPSLELIQAILTDARSGRLKKALIKTGIATSISSGSFQHQDPTIYVFDVNLQKGQSAATAEQIILRELKRLGERPVSTAELKMAVNLVKFSYYSDFETSDDQAQFLGKYESTLGDFRKGVALYQNIERHEPSQIQQVVRKYFAPANRTVIIGKPR